MKHQVIKLLQKVEQMRAAQKSFFKTKHQGALIRSKELEKEVDAELQTTLQDLEQYKMEF